MKAFTYFNGYERLAFDLLLTVCLSQLEAVKGVGCSSSGIVIFLYVFSRKTVVVDITWMVKM